MTKFVDLNQAIIVVFLYSFAERKQASVACIYETIL